MINNVKNILVSGGWGYGNIGDDAILVSTLLLLKEKHPESKFNVLTFDPIETEYRVKDCFPFEVNYIKSLHRHWTGLFYYLVYVIPYKIKNEFFQIWYIRIINIIKKVLLSRIFNYQRTVGFKSAIRTPNFDLFKISDLFVLAGGGYFNDSFIGSFDSHIMELKLTEIFKTPVLVVGQTIGPVNKRANQILISELLGSNSLISVRDKGTKSELSKYGVKSILLPDTALSEVYLNTEKKNQIGFVAGGDKSLSQKELDIVSQALIKYAKLHQFKLKILVSRTWINDIKKAKSLYENIKIDYDNVELDIPDTLLELQDNLSKSAIVVSQNLHGLILGFRACAPVVSLNSARKFEGFMNQTNQSTRIFDIQRVTINQIIVALAEAEKDKLACKANLENISNEIKKEFLNYLDCVGIQN